jgi:hypothetical protein
MAHGYLHDEYDRDFSGDDRDRGWRDRGDRDWRGQDRDWQSRGGWEDRDRGWQDRDRGRNEFMFGDRDDHRGFFDRMGDRARETFRGDEDRNVGGHSSAWENNRDYPRGRQRGYGREQSSDREFGRGGQHGGFGGGRSGYSSHPDDHYRSWRDRQMQSLDRDYADYCREREQQFNTEFESWRQNRQRQGLRVGTPLEQGSGPDEQTFTPETTAVGNTMTTSETHEPQSTTDPEDTATLGTTLGRKR